MLFNDVNHRKVSYMYAVLTLSQHHLPVRRMFLTGTELKAARSELFSLPPNSSDKSSYFTSQSRRTTAASFGDFGCFKASQRTNNTRIKLTKRGSSSTETHVLPGK